MYSVKEIFYTIQGEGAQSGRAAVFFDSPVVICGRVVRQIDCRQTVNFVTPISWVRMA